MQIRGEVPKLALIEREAPREIMNNETRYMTYLLTLRKLKFILRNIYFTLFEYKEQEFLNLTHYFFISRLKIFFINYNITNIILNVIYFVNSKPTI